MRGEVAALPLQGVIDVTAEKARLEKELARVQSDIARIDAKFANAEFVARAPRTWSKASARNARRPRRAA